MRAYTYSELWGPFACEHPGCSADTYKIYHQRNDLTHDEAISMAGDKKMGGAYCDLHAPAVPISTGYLDTY
jgi:hypothetical protein